MKEKRSAEVHLQDVDSHGMKILVEYAYTSQLAVTESNVQVHLSTMLYKFLNFRIPELH